MTEKAKPTPEAPSWRQRLAWRQQVWLLQSLWGVARRLSPAQASRLGRRVMETLGPRSRKHRHVLANLRMLCPEKDEREVADLARQCWGSIGATIAEFVHFEAIIDRQAPDPLLQVVCENQDPEFLAARRPCVFVAAHLGNWELSGVGIQAAGYPVDLVYNPQVNAGLDRLVMPRRAVLGCRLVPKQNALRRLMGSLRQGRSVGLHVDVRVDGAPLIPFAGAPAATTTLPAWLARKFGCAIVPVHTERVGDARFRIVLHPAVCTPEEARALAVEELTARMNTAIAALVRRLPHQWQCTKRRWPKEVMRAHAAYR